MNNTGIPESVNEKPVCKTHTV